ncbi:MAG: IPT/TIG domain-containing protein [Ekhidna sp.]|nr:IPT/TIG domain-containing protein [Ekhidna sp.]
MKLSLPFVFPILFVCLLSVFTFLSCGDDDSSPPKPVITVFEPQNGGVGTLLTITGENFSTMVNENTVTFHDGRPATVTQATATELKVTVPNEAATGKIRVTVNGEIGISDDDFAVIPPPAITAFAPQSGAVGTTVTITGTNFSTTVEENTVNFHNGIQAAVTNAITTALTVTVPNGAKTGAITVSVNGQRDTSDDDFTVTAAITAFAPQSGPVGSSVIITGTNFSTTANENTVTFHDGKTAAVTRATATELTVTVPNGAKTGAITVSVNGQRDTSDDDFTVTAADTAQPTADPTITAFTPQRGNVGTSITITGTNFSRIVSDNSIYFHDGIQANIIRSTATELEVNVPDKAITGKIRVEVNNRSVTSGTDFVVITATARPAPTITAFAPRSGLVGSSVTITGTNFSTTASENTVTFHDGIQADVTGATTTKLTVMVPNGAEKGKIRVEVNDKSAASRSDFTVTSPPVGPAPAPTITAFTPTYGMAGSAVTIKGANFSTTASENTVTFHNGVSALVTNATTTELTVTVPTGAKTGGGHIRVTVNGQEAIAKAIYTVIDAMTTVLPCVADQTVGPNESCTFSFPSGNKYTFSVDDSGIGCIDWRCYGDTDRSDCETSVAIGCGGIIDRAVLEPCYKGLTAVNLSGGNWRFLFMPDLIREPSESRCNECGQFPISCLVGEDHVLSAGIGPITGEAVPNTYVFTLNSSAGVGLKYPSGKLFAPQTEGTKGLKPGNQFYFLYKKSSDMVIPSKGGMIQVNNPANPDVNIFLLTLGRAYFRGRVACDKDLEFAFIERTANELLQKQDDVVYQVLRGADYCRKTVEVTVR